MELPRTQGSRARAVKLTLSLLLLGALLLGQKVLADPTGATISFVSQTTAGSGSAQNRSDPGGTITTINLNATSQNGFWKGYVGNVTGVLTLDDANGFTIYDWSLTNVTITGEVYVTRDSGVNFANVACVNDTTLAAEMSFLGMSPTTPDSINGTFNSTIHQQFVVGVQTITNSTCRAAYPYINDAPQTVNETADFQEILLQDNTSIMIYTGIIEDNGVGFDNTTYDFQMIVGNHNNATAVTYFFYTEIASA